MQYKKVKPKKLYEHVADIIEQQIVKKVILPGEKLDSVEQLAKHFEVGRSAIREALTSLQAKGLLEIRHGEGTFIKEVDVQDVQLHIPKSLLFDKTQIKNIFEIRKILEIGLIENAAKYRTNEHIEILRETLEAMKSAVFDAELSGEADILFHRTIAEAANNPLLVTMLQNVSSKISDQIIRTRELLSKTKKEALLQLHQEHIDIFNALESQDSQKAKATMESHLSNVENLLSLYLEKHKLH
nr:FadR/GntR family transcriptional regulator [Lysinibacillus timonensis]